MKKPILLSILLLTSLLARAEAPQSDYARDMLLGPVQYVIQQGDTLLRYGADGRQLDNRIEKTTFDGDTRTDEIWGYWPTYTFDERGRVVKVAYSGGETEYRYKGKGFLPVWMKESYEEGDMGDERTVVREGKLSYPRVDDRGNWLERRFDGETTVRQIVYFDAGASGVAVTLPPYEKRDTSTGETVMAIVLFVAWGAMLAHMVWLRSRDDERRYFTGSKLRLVLFAAMMVAMALFSTESIWLSAGMLALDVLVVAFVWMAYLEPESRLVARRGKPRAQSTFSFLGSLWSELENRKRNEARIASLQNRIDENQRKLDNEPLNDATRQQLEEDLNEARQDIDEEKHHHFESFVMLLFSLFVAVIYVWITPFTAIGNYCRNYLFHRTPSAGPNARA